MPDPLAAPPRVDLITAVYQGHGFGRIPSPYDPRNRAYMMMAAAPTVVARRDWTGSPIQDQGQTPECVGYSCKGWLLAKPVVNAGAITGAQLYDGAQSDDGMAMPHDGSTVHAMFQWLRDRHYISTYHWATSIAGVVGWILTEGPVVLGIDWHEGMMDPDPTSHFIRRTGDVVGGHAIVSSGADKTILCPDGTKGAIRLRNSWGPAWGDLGHAWLSMSDADALIKNWGEAVAAHELRHA